MGVIDRWIASRQGRRARSAPTRSGRRTQAGGHAAQVDRAPLDEHDRIGLLVQLCLYGCLVHAMMVRTKGTAVTSGANCQALASHCAGIVTSELPSEPTILKALMSDAASAVAPIASTA